MLVLCRHDATAVLEQLLVIPVWVDLGQFSYDAVVLAHEHRVDSRQGRLLTRSSVT